MAESSTLDRRAFLRSSAVTGLSAITGTLLSSCAREDRPRPNIIWLDAEDLSPDLSCYGNTLVKTPHLDRLAREGALYSNCFTTSPVCSPSRSAIITGMYQTSIGAQNHRSHRDDGYRLPDGVRPVTELFREAGYFCSRCEADDTDRPGKLDYNFQGSFEDFYDGASWQEAEKGQSVFAQIHFRETHRDFAPDPRNPIDRSSVQVPPYYPDHPLSRADWALYLETVQILDRKVGQILTRLEEDGLLGNAVVFFTGDHGRPMPRAKQWLYDSGIRVPLLVWGPRLVPEGEVFDDLVSAIDWVPTWLAAAGIEPPAHLQGASFLWSEKPAHEFIFAARDRCDETVDRIRCVRSRRFKYIRNFYPERPYTQFNAYKKCQYPILTLMQLLDARGELGPVPAAFMAPFRPVEELYDLEKDPYEIRNLAEDERYQEVVESFRDAMAHWIFETRDQGQIPEDPRIALYWKERARQEYLVPQMEARGLDPDIPPEEYLEWWERKLGVSN